MSEAKAINFVKAAFNKDKLANVVLNLSTDDDSNGVLFFGDIERTTEFSVDKDDNKNCLMAIDDEKHQLIHNLYRSDECFFKSAIYNASKSSRQNNTYDFQNITTHKLDPDTQLSFAVQVDNVLYALQPASEFGRYAIDCDIYSWISVNNGYILPPNTAISTAIYDKDAIISAIQTDDSILLQNRAVSANFNDIKYNMIYEIPGYQYNDFESGNVAANSFKCKNAFNSIYNMGHDLNNKLKNARQYVSIGNCNKQVYMTYKDNVDYRINGSILEGTQLYQLSCDQIEMLGTMNRYANLNGHKSNLYSIAINTDIMNCIQSSNIGNAVKKSIKIEIQHAVKKIVDKLAPINTQLLSVFINDIC